MIKFDINNPVEPAMDIQDEEEALLYLKDSVIACQHSNPSLTLEEAIKIVKDNIGYYAAYYNDEVGYRMERLFGCVHPILGDMETRTKMTMAQIYQIGLERGRKIVENGKQ